MNIIKKYFSFKLNENSFLKNLGLSEEGIRFLHVNLNLPNTDENFIKKKK